jgi:hypothetical protein
MQIGFVNFSKRWVSRQVQLPLSLFSLALIFRRDHSRLYNRLQRSHACGDYLANAQRNRTSAKQKVLPLNDRVDCSKSFHQLFRLRLHQRSKFKRRSRSGLGSRRLSTLLWNLTLWQVR